MTLSRSWNRLRAAGFGALTMLGVGGTGCTPPDQGAGLERDVGSYVGLLRGPPDFSAEKVGVEQDRLCRQAALAIRQLGDQDTRDLEKVWGLANAPLTGRGVRQIENLIRREEVLQEGVQLLREKCLPPEEKPSPAYRVG